MLGSDTRDEVDAARAQGRAEVVEAMRALATKWRDDRCQYPLNSLGASMAFIAVKQCGEELEAVLNGYG